MHSYIQFKVRIFVIKKKKVKVKVDVYYMCIHVLKVKVEMYIICIHVQPVHVQILVKKKKAQKFTVKPISTKCFSNLGAQRKKHQMEKRKKIDSPARSW
jgi:hypothetical protein